MKPFFTLLLLTVLSGSYLSAQAAQQKGSPEPLKSFSFPHLLKAGEYHRFGPYCTTPCDSFAGGAITVKKASIDTVIHGRVELRVANDTLRYYSVRVSGRKNVHRLAVACRKKYGHPFDTMDPNQQNILEWEEPFGETQKIVTRLIFSENGRRATLTSEIDARY